MVYIYKKPVGNKTYYYLRASERKNGKIVIKDIAYLGSSLKDVRKNLEKHPRHSEKIRKAYRTIHNFLESNRYLQKAKYMKLKKDDWLSEKTIDIEACKIHYIADFQRQPYLTKQEIYKNFIIEFAYNTTSIEGNTIKLEEARKLLDDGLTPKNRTLREIYDLQNTEKVFLTLLENKNKKEKQRLSNNLIIDIHKNLMENIDPRTGYRTSDVRVIKANFKATPEPYVKTDMDLLLKWYERNRRHLHPLVIATIFHHKFEKIHPFMDGNGRVGRIILNFILLNNEYPPFIVHKKKRDAYLQALRTADRSELTKADKENYQKLIDFMVEEMTDSYWNVFL